MDTIHYSHHFIVIFYVSYLTRFPRFFRMITSFFYAPLCKTGYITIYVK